MAEFPLALKALVFDVFFCLTVCLFASLVPQSASAIEYELEGRMVQTGFSRGVKTFTYQSDFTVYVRDCSWLIRISEMDGYDSAGLVRETGSINGTEVFELILPQGRSRFTFSGLTTNGTAAAPTNANKGNPSYIPIPGGNVISNVAPAGFESSYESSHLWMLFASQCYFADLNTNRLRPFYENLPELIYFAYPNLLASWELLNGPGSLPGKVTYYNYKLHEIPRASYVVTKQTNSGATILPLEFRFEEYSPDLARGSNSPAVIRRAEGLVTRVSPVCSRADLLPEINATAYITDFRLRNSSNRMEAFSYHSRRWLPVSDGLKLAEQEKHPQK